MPPVDHFGLLAPFYERLIPFRYPEKLKLFADLPVSGKVLDVGGGTGRVGQAICPLADEVVVADLSWGMLSQARNKDDLDLVCSQSERLPFDADSFDRVLMIDALHHVIDQAETLSELWRVLKSGGRLVVAEPDIRQKVVKFIALFEKVALMRSHFLPPEAIASHFTGLEAWISIQPDGFNIWVILQKA